MKNVVLLMMLVGVLFVTFVAQGEWGEQEVQNLTAEFQKYKRDWTLQNTINVLKKSQNSGTYKTWFNADNGKGVWVEIKAGNTVLLNGKDVTGNLGSKTTHGNNSPIIDNVRNSQITTGDKSPIKKDVAETKYFTLHISLSIGLALSIAVNIVLSIALKRQLAANKALH